VTEVNKLKSIFSAVESITEKVLRAGLRRNDELVEQSFWGGRPRQLKLRRLRFDFVHGCTI